MFSSFRLKLSIIICYEKNIFLKKIKSLFTIHLKKAFENITFRKLGDF